MLGKMEIGKADLQDTKEQRDLSSREVAAKEAQGLPKDISAKSEANELPSEINPSKEEKRETPHSRTETAENAVKELPERIEPPIIIVFKCPEGYDKKEFSQQIKGQERGLNSQSVADNIANRVKYEERKAEVGDGRAPEANIAQQRAREKALKQRELTNREKGMSYGEAKQEASKWIKTQAALHNPDQIAGGDPSKVSRMGDAKINSSIGGQWKNRVEQLSENVADFANEYTMEELSAIKMNVRLEVA